MKPMTAEERDAMGKVTVDIELLNEGDLIAVREGRKALADVRSISVNATVDTGSTMLILPNSLLQKLGLGIVRKAKSRIADGRIVERPVCGPARLKVMGREVLVEVAGGSDGIPTLLGQIPLEALDFHVDPKNQRLIPNPESPDMAMIDVF